MSTTRKIVHVTWILTERSTSLQWSSSLCYLLLILGYFLLLNKLISLTLAWLWFVHSFLNLSLSTKNKNTPKARRSFSVQKTVCTTWNAKVSPAIQQKPFKL